MPTVKADQTEAPAEEPVEEFKPTGFTDGLAWEIHEFRGIRYKIQELPIGEYDDIAKKATRKERVTDPDTGQSQEIETLDQQLQSRMMLKACIVEPERVDITKLGTRLLVTLNRIVNRLHYGDEPDALAPKAKDEDSSDEDAKPGNR